ncbi:MAG: DNA primase [Acholeplasma sp.]|nr:DNA primase [Acholeplasma sp.]
MISKEILERIDNETDIVSLASEFISLEKRGKNYMGLCPFHDEKTPSFSVSTEKNIAMCMGCGEGGRPINFYRKIKNISLAQAAFELGERLGIEVKEFKEEVFDENEKYYKIMEDASNYYTYNLFNSVSGEKVLAYLENRKLSQDTIKHFKIGYSPRDKDLLYQFLKSKSHSVSDMIDLGLVKQSNDGSYYDLFNNRLMFPITNNRGRVIAFSGRTLDKNDNIKYVNSPETKIFKKGSTLYRGYEANLEIRKRQKVLLFEGFFDVISAYQAGVSNGIATMGTALTNDQATMIRKLTKNIVIAYDGDSAGQKATLSAIPLLIKNRLVVEVLKIPNKFDPDDYIKKHGSEGFNTLLEQNVFDSYNYQYDYYFENTDINNANSVSTFQRNIENMLKGADKTIVALYEKRLASDLNISKDQVTLKVEKPDYEFFEATELPKSKRKKLPSKYEQSEKRILILMFRSRIWYERIIERINIYEYSVVLLGAIRTKLSAFYENNYEFDLTEFKSILSEEEVAYLEEDIFTDIYWEDQIILSDRDIDTYIKLIKATPLLRRIEYLKDKMIRKNNKAEDITNESEEFRRAKLELDLLKEDINGI